MSTSNFAKTSSGEIVYRIRLLDTSEDGSKRKIYKSYNQFSDFHKHFGEHVPSRLLPMLPPIGFSLFNPTKFHEQRGESLQIYINNIYSLDGLNTCPYFLNFIGVKYGNDSAKSSPETQVKEIIQNSGLTSIDVPEIPHDKIPRLKELSLATVCGSANKLLVQFNALYANLNDAKNALEGIKLLSKVKYELDQKTSLLNDASHKIEEALTNDKLSDSGDDDDILAYLTSLLVAINEGKNFISSLDILISLLLVQNMEEKTKKENINAEIAEGYVPWYLAQVDRLVPMLFSDNKATSDYALEFLRVIESSMVKDAQTSRDLGDDATCSLLESTRMEVARSIQSRLEDNGTTRKSAKISEVSFNYKAQQFETAMFDLISKADSVNSIDDPGAKESATERYHSQIQHMMRDLRQLRIDISKAITTISEDKTLEEDEKRRRVCSLERISEKVEELQQNIGDFEEAWSRRVTVKPTVVTKAREEQVSIVQKETLALDDDLYEL